MPQFSAPSREEIAQSSGFQPPSGLVRPPSEEPSPPRPTTPRHIDAEPILTELHTHYAGVLSPEEFVDAIFLHHDRGRNLKDAYERIKKADDASRTSSKPLGLLGNLRDFFMKVAEADQAGVVKYVLAVRNPQLGSADPRCLLKPGDPRAPNVNFASTYPLRNTLLRCWPPRGTAALSLNDLRAGRRMQANGVFKGGHVWLDPVEFRATCQQFLEASLGGGRPVTLYVKTDPDAIQQPHAPSMRLAGEILCDAYREHTARHPHSRVRVVADSGTVSLLVARQVIANRREDGIRTVEMQGTPGIPIWLFRELGHRHTPPVEATFLKAFKTRWLSDEFPEFSDLAWQDFRDEAEQLHLGLRTGEVNGLDINGPESRFSEAGMRRLTLLYALLAGNTSPPRERSVLRVHVGEGKLFNAQLRPGDRLQCTENIGLLVRTVKSWRTESLVMSHDEHGCLKGMVRQVPPKSYDQEVVVRLDPKRVEVRLGHVTHLTLRQALDVVENGIPVEVNIHSNYATGTVQRIDQAPVLTLLLADALLRSQGKASPPLSLHLSTDAGGVMGGTVEGERERYIKILNDFFNDPSSEAHIKVREDEKALLDDVIEAYDALDQKLPGINSLDMGHTASQPVLKFKPADFNKGFRGELYAAHQRASQWPRDPTHSVPSSRSR